ncbi:MAG: FKBP-type peptidyl-prolyl cis-trans isomerase [Candidatus Undinarchaeales archaeon]|jgi:FKBP-type peptidyl-prolyl cis-trans isomerase 2|nr:FKBP-type peptidyl-prolyl cis-trans isomerase [Candidatus Undinarchaeales archaeon]
MADSIKEGDFITIDYVGKVKATGKIFDLTREDVAKKEGMMSDNAKYGPVTIIVGAQHVIPGLDKHLSELKVGDTKKFDISPVDGFGNRDATLLKLIPRSEFKKRDVKPMPGMPVNFDGQYGFVQSVSGGRIKVDFNHPLAGKDLEYEVEIHDKIEKQEDQIKSLFRFHLSKVDTTEIIVKLTGNNVEITSPKNPQTRRYINLTEDIVARDIIKYIGGIETVKFIDIFEKPKPVKQAAAADKKS